jgi:hypothetical protein
VVVAVTIVNRRTEWQCVDIENKTDGRRSRKEDVDADMKTRKLRWRNGWGNAGDRGHDDG